MTFYTKKLKTLTLTFGTAPDEEEFQCQVQNWEIQNNTEDGEKLYSYCGAGTDGEKREEAEPDYALDLNLYADWRANKISKFLTVHDEEEMDFRVDHHPDDPDAHVAWSGRLKIKAPNAGGEARTTEMSAVTLPIIGKPEFHPSGGES